MLRKIMDLFLVFAKIGVFTFGGGYAMISVIENSCVDKRKWITHDEMMDAAFNIITKKASLGAIVYTVFPG